jgi:hypothetical protein
MLVCPLLTRLGGLGRIGGWVVVDGRTEEVG